MRNYSDSKVKMIKKAVVILAVFSMMFFLDFTSAAENNGAIQFEIKKENVSPDSPFLNPEPRIDKEAASIEKTDEGEKNYEILLKQNNHCASFPQSLWVMLLAAYVFLLIFNLTYEFGKNEKLRWFWEALYTILALFAWFKFDECRQFSWFAQSVILEGIIIYAFYLYYFNKNHPAVPHIEKEEKTAKLPLE